MALTLAEANKLSNDVLLQGVIETIIKDSPILQVLPFIEIVGNGLTYNRENAAPTAGFYAVGDTWTEDTPTFTQIMATLSILGGNLLHDIPEMMSFRDLLYYALTGENFTGKQAAEMRFINFAVPKEELRDKVWAIAENLKKKAPEALQSTKIATRLSLHMDREQQSQFILAMSAQAGRAADARGTGGTKRALEQFMDKSYRPAFGEYDWETSESKPR